MAVQRLSNSGQSGYGYKSLIAGITPIPSVPTIGSATAVNFESVNVAFTAPGAYAGSTYTATSSPGGLTGTSASSPILVTGLSELTAYTFTVTATNATGTSGASAASDAVTTPAGDNGVMFPIQMVSVGAAGASTIEFTSIPSTYTHLQIRGIGRTTTATTSVAFFTQFNSDTASNYNYHYMYADSTTAYSGGSANESNIYAFRTTGASATSGMFGAGVIDILDYKNTNKYKTLRSLSGENRNGDGYVFYCSGAWRSTSAITSIKLFYSSGNFAQYSQFALYGIKGA